MLLVTSAVGDREQVFEMYLPLELAVEDARRMLRRAIELARNLAAQPVCGAPAGGTPGWKANSPDWEDEIRRMPPGAPIESSIYEHDGTTTVSLGQYEFDFAGTTGDVEAREFKCWGIPVIVA